MSYATSIQSGRLIELFLFQSAEHAYRYTSAATDIVALGETWAHVPISRTEPEQGPDIGRANIKLTFPRDNEFALRQLLPWIDDITSVTIWSEDDVDDWVVEWKGRVASGSLTGSQITIDCESVMASSRRNGLPRRVTRSCGHAVYHRGCWLDKADWAVPAVVTGVDGVTITVPEAALQANGWYLGGMLEFGNSSRWIVGHEGDQITLLRPIDGLAESLELAGYGYSYGLYYGGAAVTIYPGCDRTRETCDQKFDNLLNRLGFDWRPDRSPYDGSSVA